MSAATSDEAGPGHPIAVIGGACAGAEIACRLAEGGFEVAVFEQNVRPYGKIEDGLPRWHQAQRVKEYELIAGKLGHERVELVPCTKIGRDVDFAELVEEWGFSAVVLASGAWRDRSLPIEGAEQYVGKGLIYQNPIIYWFNHYEEAGYDGPQVTVEDEALVVGGGLASIDVAKLLMLETTRAACRERGIEVDLLEMEKRGIPKTLDAAGIGWQDLGLKGCTLVYRRRVEDMPIMDMPEDASPERAQKVEQGRLRMMKKAQDKYCFNVEPLAAPEALLVEGDRAVGLQLRRTRVEGGKVLPLDELFELRGSLIVSSIGSIPEAIPGLEMEGERFVYSDFEHGRIARFSAVFAAGNAVTGKGNIIASRKHAASISEHVIESFMGLSDDDKAAEGVISESLESSAGQSAAEIEETLRDVPLPSSEQRAALRERVAARQREVGYGGDLAQWLEKVAPG